MKKKILKYVLIGISVFVAVITIELCCFYAALGDDFWNYLKDTWDWYSSFFLL